MQKTLTIFLLCLSTLAIFKSATPFLSYKVNYEFISSQMCEFRGTDKHDDCDGFCYLRKNIEHQHGGEQEQPHSDKAIYSYQFSSMYGLLESHKNPSSPYLKSERYGLYSNLNLYTIYPDILSPPPRS